MRRKRIQPDEKVAVRLSARDRDLRLEGTLVDPEYAERLLPARTGDGLAGAYTLDDLEEILGYVAAEANHPVDKGLRRELDALYGRLFRAQWSFDDGHWNDSAV